MKNLYPGFSKRKVVCSKPFRIFVAGLWFLLGSGHLGLGASNKSDSLTTRLQQNLHDTDKINTLNLLGWELMYNDPDTAIYLSQEALSLAEKLKDSPTAAIAVAGRYGMAKSNLRLGVFNWLKGDYPKALEYYFKSLKIDEELGNKSGMAATLGNIGIICKNQGDYTKALDYFFKSLKMQEELGKNSETANTNGNIGTVYLHQGDFPKALDHFFKALKIMEEVNDKKGIATILGNIGIIYNNQGETAKALDYFFKSLKINEDLGNQYRMASTLHNIGGIYLEQGEIIKTNPVEQNKLFGLALDYFLKSLKIAEEVGHKKGIAINLGNIGSLYTTVYEIAEKSKEEAVSLQLEGHTIPHQALLDSAIAYQQRAFIIRKEMKDQWGVIHSLNAMGSILVQQQKLKEALGFFRHSYALADTISVLPEKMDAAQRLYSTFKILHRSDSALTWHERYVTHKDSIFNEEKLDEIGKLEARHEYEKELLERKREQEKKDLTAEEEAKRQQLITWSAMGGAGLMLLLALVAIHGYRNKQKANRLLEDKNKIIEEKNKDITDSINYAKNIQQAMLPFDSRMRNAMPEHFVLFKPKDIVSGDFYWFVEKEDKIFLAVVDCTGHGVPGAFMSMIGSAILSHIIGEQNIIRADLILNEMHKQVRTALKQEDTNNKDGMDLVLVVIDKENKKLEFAGAMNPLYIVRNNTIETIKGDKTAIGGSQDEEERVFTLHTIPLEEPVSIYLSTDGYPDQFGGPKGKKFKYKAFKELLLANVDNPMAGQKEVVDTTFEDWKGSLEQIDDVCVIGVRI